MSYEVDKVKLLEAICAKLLPFSMLDDEHRAVDITEDDLKDIDLSFNRAMMIIRDLFDEDVFNSVNVKDKVISLIVDEKIEAYTHKLQYPSESIPNNKTLIYIDTKKGIYKEENLNEVYKIKYPSKRFSLILSIAKEDKLKISDLSKKLNQDQPLLVKEIKEINALFRSNLSLTNDLILRLPTSGYVLNKDSFEIKIS